MVWPATFCWKGIWWKQSGGWRPEWLSSPTWDRCVRWPVEGTAKDLCWKFLGFEHVNMPFTRHSDEMEYVRRLSNWGQKGTDTRTLDLTRCSLRKPLESYHLVQDPEEYKLFFIVLPLKWGLYYVGLVPVAPCSLTFIAFVALSALRALPATRYKLFRNVFCWLNGVFFGGLPVPENNLFQGRSGSDVSHLSIDCLLELVRRCDTWETTSIRGKKSVHLRRSAILVAFAIGVGATNDPMLAK